MSYQYGATGIPELLEHNRELRSALAKAEQTIHGLRSRKKARRHDDYPPTTREDLMRELNLARALFPEPVEVKEARVTELNRELANTDRRTARSTLRIAA